MTFTANERSVEDSRPVELFLFTSQRASPNAVVARSTSYHRDVSFGGQTYTKRTIRRGATAVNNASDNSPETTVEVLATDPAAVFYMGLAVPPQNFECIIRRLQLDSSGASVGNEDVFRGVITDARQQGRTVVFSITEQLDDPLATKFPSNQLSLKCQRVLYDTGCTISRAAHQVDTTISNINDFRAVTVAAIGAFAVGDFRFGELLHIASGERRHIVKGSGTRVLTLDCRLPSTAANSDAVSIWRGCNRLVEQCRDRFDNVPNFGGDPFLKPRRMIWSVPKFLLTEED